MESQSQWYKAEEDQGCFDVAKEAFEEAIGIFKATTTDPRKCSMVDAITSLEDLQREALSKKAAFDDRHENQKSGKWLEELSSRIVHYGNVMDVLVQHHPEYVSLAWGAMKVLFVLVENQAKLVQALAKALSQISTALPQMKLAAVLYPTKRMKQALAEVYAYMIRFFIRAKDWYQQSKPRRAWNSLVRPVELYYSDLIENIKARSYEIETLANTGSHAEQRDMHLVLQELDKHQEASSSELRRMNKRQEESMAILLEVQQRLISIESLNSNAFLNTNSILTDIQLNQIMDFLSQAGRPDPLKLLQYYANTGATRRRVSQNTVGGRGSQFWLHSKFEKWERSAASGLILLKGDYRDRLEIKTLRARP